MLRITQSTNFPVAQLNPPWPIARRKCPGQFFATDALRLPYAYNGNLALKQRKAAVWHGVRPEMRIMHYTLVKPFVSRDWQAVPLERLQERVQEAAAEKGGLFREEMELWGRTWEETSVVYAHNIERCAGLRDTVGAF